MKGTEKKTLREKKTDPQPEGEEELGCGVPPPP